MTHLVGYVRVSTSDQTTQLQMDALIAHGVAPEDIHSDSASGAIHNRPGLQAALKDLREGDILVIWKLDRLSRRLEDAIRIVGQIAAKNAHLRCLTQAIDTTTPGGRFVFHIFAAMAEFERELGVERTKAGLAAATARGRKGGRKRKVDAEGRARALARLEAGDNVKAIARDFDVKPAAVYRWRREGA